MTGYSITQISRIIDAHPTAVNMAMARVTPISQDGGTHHMTRLYALDRETREALVGYFQRQVQKHEWEIEKYKRIVRLAGALTEDKT